MKKKLKDVNYLIKFIILFNVCIKKNIKVIDECWFVVWS